MKIVSGKVDEKATQLHAIASLKVINSEIYINNEIILIEFLAELFCIKQTLARSVLFSHIHLSEFITTSDIIGKIFKLCGSLRR